MTGDNKIRSEHLSREAYIYVRQSSPGQVLKHTESARRQRDLVKLAEAFGWPSSRIHLLDADQGKSGQVATGREAFKQMAGAVSVGEVGIIIGIEVSRVGRNAAEWFPLIEVCALTQTLIADEQGVYDPNDPNDRLILGVKVTISEAELTTMRSRLQGARWSRARRGELRRKIPAGYIWDEQRRIALDPDERVRSAIRSFFQRFREVGSAIGLARAWNQDGLLFPVREVGGRWDGRVLWRLLECRYATHVLHNPFYAGAYYYGARRAKTIIDPATSARKSVMLKLPMESWEVLIREAHEGYISWEEFVRNQEILRENWCMPHGGAGAARSGAALLQGIAFCSKCGRKMTMRYSGRHPEPTYICIWHRKTGELCYCLSIQAARVDPWVEKQILEAIQPMGIEAAIAAMEELEKRSEDLRQQWQHRIEQAEYEVSLARRRYEAVDPDNRLVARNLEREWEEKLREVEALKKEYEERAKSRPMHISEEDRRRVHELVQDLPRLWHAKSTKESDRKKVVRLLIREVWLRREHKNGPLRLKIHWQTGAVTAGEIAAAESIAGRNKLSEAIIERVRELSKEPKSSREIAEQLNAEGYRTSTGTLFRRSGVDYILRNRGIVKRGPSAAGSSD